MVIMLCDFIFGIVEVIGGGFEGSRGNACFGDISRVLCEGPSPDMYILRFRAPRKEKDGRITRKRLES